MTPSPRSHLRLGGLVVGLFLAGAATGILAPSFRIGRSVSAHPVERREGSGGLVNPLLECENGEASVSSELRPLESRVEDLIDDLVAAHQADEISVYFRQATSGAWWGVNENEEYIGGSLFKVALLIGYLRVSERDPAILDQPVVYDGRYDQSAMNQRIKPKELLQPGHSYRVRQLLERMVRYSDNESAWMLLDATNLNVYGGVFAALGLNAASPTISARDYATFFRVLYNASLLDTDTSETALELLTTPTFVEGLVAGVPAGVQVAHKFGERIDEKGSYLHDCGLVYHPRTPYVLCVMTRGRSLDGLEESIAAISRKVWQSLE